jgi:hypothetical protein
MSNLYHFLFFMTFFDLGIDNIRYPRFVGGTPLNSFQVFIINRLELYKSTYSTYQRLIRNLKIE